MAEEPKYDKLKRTVVLDIDGTLVHSVEYKTEKELQNFKRAIGNVEPGAYFHLEMSNGTKMISFRRPHLDYFIHFLFSYFDRVVVWTAGVEEYAEKICNHIFKGENYPNQILSRNDCTIEKISDDAVIYVKDLRILQRRMSTVFIIDDNPDSAKLNPDNLFKISDWMFNMRNDIALKSFIYYVYENRDCIHNNSIQDIIRCAKNTDISFFGTSKLDEVKNVCDSGCPSVSKEHDPRFNN